MERPITIVEAPSILGLRPTGVERLPEALLEAGLAEAVGGRRAGAVRPPVYDDRRDESTKLLNPRGIAEYSHRLAEAVGRTLDAGEFPLVLGGDCSILLGNLLALRRRGRYGLLFLDGHTDFYQAEANVNGEVASSDLALATGRGPEILTRFDGLYPLVLDDNVAVVGYRDAEESAEFGSQPLPPAMLALDLASVRRTGVETAARLAIAHLTRPNLDGFWVHLDVDVLSDELMPAVDYRLPGGLAWDEVRMLLSTALASGRAAGLDVTIFNPALDGSGRLATQLVELLAGILDPDAARQHRPARG